MDLIDRLRTYASTRKGELAELITEAADALERQTCEDDPRADVYYLAEKIGIHRLYALVVELRGEPESCDDAVSRQQAIDALMVRDKELRNINWYDKPYAEGECRGIDEALTIVSNMPSVQPDFDITVKIDKAYDDGYKAGYLQGRHDWGDLDE